MMDFYAFLPSNASPEVYRDNKTSHFKIELSKRMELHGQWQAALIELHYPNTKAQVLEGENMITLLSEGSVDSVYIKAGCYPSKKDFLAAVSTAVTVLNNDIQNDTPLRERDDLRVEFTPFLPDREDVKVHFAPRLALQLGLDHPGPYPANESITGVKPVDLNLGIPPQLFVYMDILAAQIIGHTRAPILRTVPVDINARFGTMSIFHCEHPLYFDLNTRSFDTVQIDIRDHAGRYVPFDFGTSTLLVHFRQLS